MKTIAIVTGANGGFGKELAKILVRQKDVDEVWAIARNRQRLDALKRELGDKIKVINMDLTNRHSLERVKRLLEYHEVKVKYLVNNAGCAKVGSYGDISVKDTLNMIDLNVSAVVAISQICIPYMPRGSHIINVSSQAAFFPLPYMNAYAASKAFVKNYTRALNVELKERWITATAVCPGWMSTELIERANVGSDKTITNFYGMVSPDLVARRAFIDAKCGKDVSTYGLFTEITRLLSKAVPAKVAMQVWMKMQKFK